MKIQIDGVGTVELDDTFAGLPADRQNEIIHGIVASMRGGASAPAEPKQVTTPNGRTLPEGYKYVGSTNDRGDIYRRPDGMLGFVSPSASLAGPENQETIQKMLQLHDISPAKAAAQDQLYRSAIDQHPVAARGVSFVKGVPFAGGWVDELISKLPGVDGPKAQAGVRLLSDAQEHVNPVEDAVLGVGGGIAGSAAAAAAAPEAALGWITGAGSRILPAALRGLVAGAGLGAAEGAVSGAGRGDNGNRADSARTGAMVGGALGGVMGAATPYISRGIENVYKRVAQSDVRSIAKELGISPKSAAVIRDVFDRGGDFSDAYRRLEASGDEAMLADAGTAAQVMLDAASNASGKARQITADAIDGRMERTRATLSSALDSHLGPAADGKATFFADLAERTAPARAEAYGAAYSAPIDYASDAGRQIEAVLSRIPADKARKAIGVANDLMQMSGEKNRQIMVDIGPDGGISFKEMPNVMQLDYIKRALQNVAYAEHSNPMTGRLDDLGSAYEGIAAQLRDATGAAVPDYLRAVKIGGDKLREERAFDLGSRMLSSSVEKDMLTPRFGGPNSAMEQAAARAGLRSSIDRTMSDIRRTIADPGTDAGAVYSAVKNTSSDNSREKIRRLLGPNADELLRELDKAGQSVEFRASQALNSKTAQREATREAVEMQTQPGMLGRLMAGEPANAGKELVQVLTGHTRKYTAEQQRQIYDDIASALTEKRGSSARAALKYIEKAMQGQPMTDAQARFVSSVAGASMSGAATSTGNRLGAQQ